MEEGFVSQDQGGDEQGVGEAATGALVMLALSTFRYSDRAVELAIEKAREGKRLVVVHIVDVNLARYLIGTSIGLYPELQTRCEQELLQEYEQEGRQKVDAIAQKAEPEGISVKKYVAVGRFGPKCVEIVEKERPELIVTTRSKRPQWVRRFFGSPVDYLIANAGCPVIET